MVTDRNQTPPPNDTLAIRLRPTFALELSYYIRSSCNLLKKKGREPTCDGAANLFPVGFHWLSGHENQRDAEEQPGYVEEEFCECQEPPVGLGRLNQTNLC